MDTLRFLYEQNLNFLGFVTRERNVGLFCDPLTKLNVNISISLFGLSIVDVIKKKNDLILSTTLSFRTLSIFANIIILFFYLIMTR